MYLNIVKYTQKIREHSFISMQSLIRIKLWSGKGQLGFSIVTAK